MERLVFGDPKDIINNLQKSEEPKKEEPDRTTNLPEGLDDSDESKDSDFWNNRVAENDEADTVQKDGKAVWIDEDDVKYT